MFSKRLRNKKLEQNRPYQVFYLTDLNPYDLIDYHQQNVKTGIEQDEEKETHLKEVLTGGRKEILVPGIASIQKNEKEKTKQKSIIKKEFIEQKEQGTIETAKIKYHRPENFIKYRKDCKNEIILSDDDKKVLDENEMTENEFLKKLNEIMNKRSDDLLDESTQRVKKIIEQNFSHRLLKINEPGSSGCFRRLTTHMIRKNRRSESSTIEKLKRLWIEINEIETLMQLKAEQNEINQSLIEVCEKLTIFHTEISNIDLKDRKKIYNNIFLQEKNKVKPFFLSVNFDELLNSKRKRLELQKILRQKKGTIRQSEIDALYKIERFLK